MASVLEKHVVPGQSAGYSYQLDLALDQLADGDAVRVGVETLDDVAKLGIDGTATLVQGKSSVDDESNPFSDAAFGLWNALHTWGDALNAGEIDPPKARFVLTSTAAIPACLARTIGDADTDEKATACISRIKSIVRISKKAQPHVDAVRLLPDTVLRALVLNIRCSGKEEGMGVAALHRRIAAKLKLPSDVNAETIIEELLGWLKLQLHRKWIAREPGWIRQEDFNNRLYAAVEKNRRRQVRELPARELVCSPDQIATHKTSCFVRQLELIDADSQQVEDGILAYLRHNQERLRLTAEGEIPDSDWEDFDGRLLDHWTPIFNKHTKGIPKGKQRSAGQAVYNEVQNHRERLAGLPTSEYYLTRGGFHRLADGLTVGWHPDYKKRCSSFRRAN